MNFVAFDKKILKIITINSEKSIFCQKTAKKKSGKLHDVQL